MNARAPQQLLTTAALAGAIGIKPESIRVRLCRRGDYFGITPQKLANGRLLWPADAVEKLAGGQRG